MFKNINKTAHKKIKNIITMLTEFQLITNY